MNNSGWHFPPTSVTALFYPSIAALLNCEPDEIEPQTFTVPFSSIVTLSPLLIASKKCLS